MALSTIKPMSIQRNIKILNSCEDLFFDADPSDMDIMFNNLISNAVKYNRDGGSVEVSACQYGQKVEILVKDTGIGMSEAEVSQLFKE